MERNMTKDINYCTKLLASLGDVIGASTVLLYKWKDHQSLNLQIVGKNEKELVIKKSICINKEIYLNKVEEYYISEHFLDNHINIEIPLYDKENILFGIIVILKEENNLKNYEIDVIKKYIILLKYKWKNTQIKDDFRFVVDKHNNVIEYEGVFKEAKFFKSNFINKKISEIYSVNISNHLNSLINKSIISKKEYIYILELNIMEKKLLIRVDIHPFENDKVIIKFYSMVNEEKTNENMHVFNIQIYTSYIIKRLLKMKKDNMIDTLKELVNELGIVNRVDQSFISLYNDELSEKLLFYNWCKEGNEDAESLFQDVKTKNDLKNYIHPTIFAMNNIDNDYIFFGVKKQALIEAKVKSLIIVTFGQRGKFSGFIGMSYETKYTEWSKEQKNCMQIFCDVLSNALSWYDLKNEIYIKDNQYENLVEKSPDVLIRFDKNYKIIYTNTSIEKYSFKKSELVDKVLFDNKISNGILLDKYIDYLYFMQLNKKEYELNINTEEGNYYRVRLIPELNSLGDFETGILIITNLTEYIKIEKQKNENEEKLKLAIEASNAVIWDIDIKSGDINYSQNEFNLLKYKDKSPIMSNKLYYRKIKRQIIKYLKESKTNINKRFKYEAKIKDDMGKSIWLLIQGKVTNWDIDNKPLNIMGTAIDVTDTKLREKQIKYLAEHDSLTGLYNRMYFEKKLNELDQESNFPLGIIMIDVDGLKVINDAFGHTMGDDLIKYTAKALNNAFGDIDSIISRIGGDEFAVIVSNIREEILEKYSRKINDELSNEKVISVTPSVSIGYAIKQLPHQNITSIYKKAEDIMYKSKLLKSTSTRSTIIKSLQKALQEKTHETEEHCSRIRYLATKIAKKMSLNDSDIDDVILLSGLHDIGKIAIPESILRKPGKLNEEEWIIMKTHCEIGYRIASSTKDIYSIAEDILSHHERWDGQGYPRGLKGVEIPLISRIISVVDSYDAMTNDRIYRKAMSSKAAIEEISRCSGSQFDPEIVNIFEKIMKDDV
ncbi:MAG: HD domain-containing phosphohydrolase [Eubacteriaceae bacterium]